MGILALRPSTAIRERLRLVRATVSLPYRLLRPSRRAWLTRVAWLVAALAPGASLADSVLPSDAELERSGAVIRQVLIDPRPIFDESLPGERTYLFRLANRLHIETKASVIRAQLLFATGDKFSARVLRETERNLRQLRFLREPQIRVVAVEGNQVDIEVRTIDVWTLNPTLEFARSGGHNRTSVGIEDFNFLGYGKTLEVSHKSDRDRNSNVIAYNDPNLNYTRWRLDLEFSDNSDGHEARASIQRPFYALSTENSYGFSVEDDDALARRYALGDEVDVYRHQQMTLDAFVGYSQGLVDNWSIRHTWGLRYDRARFDAYAPGPMAAAPPADRTLAYPYYRFEAIEDDFDTIMNRDVIGRTEDEAYGRRYLAEIGAATRALGSDRSAAVIRLEASDGFRLSLDDEQQAGIGRDQSLHPARQSLFLRGSWNARVENGGLVDDILGVGARYFYRQSENSTFYMALSGDFGHRLDADHDLLLGGDNGMRAYPLAFQSGDKRALFTIEQRYFTDWQIWRTFTVGAAAFADVGRVWGDNAIDAPSLGTIKDFGIGLRFGNLRSARANILHVDLAWPLDDPTESGPQLMIETRSTF
jgi:hypothetical protein